MLSANQVIAQVTSTKSNDAGRAPGAGVTDRVVELQNPLDRVLYHPLAARLARALAGTFVTPNMVSVAGGLAIVAAGLIYIQPGWPLPALLGLLVHMGWHVFDGADGTLARMTGRASPSGEIIDGICDYAGHIVLYLMLAGAAFVSEGWLVWALAVAAGLSRVLQANFHEVQRRHYLNWTYGVAWLGSGGSRDAHGILALAGRTYLHIATLLAPEYPDIGEVASDPARSEQVAARMRELGPSALSGSALLGANYRTLALGASMIAGTPLWYFIYEAVFLNLVLFASVSRSRLTIAGLREALQLNPSTRR
ncbi:MAG: CDP-alcohol phosphatidyltransferase family protein [Erythrobacter sp.]